MIVAVLHCMWYVHVKYVMYYIAQLLCFYCLASELRTYKVIHVGVWKSLCDPVDSGVVWWTVLWKGPFECLDTLVQMALNTVDE